jgi:ubiquinone/menaquinone biosynthesis C-methylase UbiE
VLGGILVNNPRAYDAMTRVIFGPFFDSVAANVAATAPAGGRVLDVGSGPGHLALRLAGDHGLDVTGIDLDPAMIERAEANKARAAGGGGANAAPADGEGASADGAATPTFVVADVAALPFPDESFDVVVSTMSMHHWDDAQAGLSEIARVLRPGGRALIWDLRRGRMPFHPEVPEASKQALAGPLRVVDDAPWRWPWQFSFSERLELAKD